MSTIGNLHQESFGPEVYELDQGEFPRPWTASQWKSLDDKNHTLFVWRSGSGELLSFALFGVMEGDNAAHLYKIVTRPQLRGTSISKEFFQALVGELGMKGYESIYLEVEVGNKRALRFYEKMGLKILRLSKRFYSDGEDAFIMSMTLPARGI